MASAPSTYPIATRSKNCTRSGSQWIKPPTSLTRCAAPGGAPMMSATTTEGEVGPRQRCARTMMTRRRTTTDKYSAIVPPPPRFGMATTMTTTTTTTTMIQTMARTSMSYVSSTCTHATNAVHKQFWLCNPTAVEGSDCFAMRTIRTREGGYSTPRQQRQQRQQRRQRWQQGTCSN